MADDQVAAGHQGVPQGGHDLGDGVLAGDEVQHRHQQQPHRLGEVDEQLGFRVGEDLGRLAQIGLDDGGVRVIVQDEPAVRDRDLVVVHVDDPRARPGLLGGLVHGL